ncbi:urease subunit beta/urease subunit gamma/beta [Flavobacterium araucananum]|uniref:Urease subunit beta n=1 Tax=Flavobacterium araucananum TaxID=946678 RepID=A0A227NV48_9FLAO|nr:urease subunit beta [Flavobacterium araucananum]OXG01580.1 urease subunit beta [Flavobacterium araucananum]PWJ98969.1 urease subunit beta/urease subunit gamma/beta [Flavobacterium araucananum]
MIPGETFIKEGDIILNEGRETTSITVVNTGDRPIQIGSHFHFFEVNKAMKFDREKAFCMRLNIPAGTAVRFEPGEEKEINLVKIGGTRKIIGLNNLVNGDANVAQNKEKALELVDKLNFKNISK